MKKYIFYLISSLFCQYLVATAAFAQANFIDTLQVSKDKTAPTHIEFADFDSDGNQDILAITADSLGWFSISISKQKFENQLATFIKMDSVFGAMFSNHYLKLNVKLADIDNDNDIDLILTSNDSTQSRFMILANKGNFKFDSLYATTLANLGDFAISDFNNDGFKDIFISANVLDSASKKANIILNNANKFEVKEVKIPILGNAVCYSLDYDNNQRDDIFISGIDSLGKVSNAIFLNNNLEFDAQTLPIGNVAVSLVAMGDYNNDGMIDMVFSGKDKQGIYKTKLLLNTEVNAPAAAVDSTFFSYTLLSIVDLNHDGMSDILMSGKDANGLAINKINYGSKDSLAKFKPIRVLDSLNFIVGIGDMNADGNPDLYAYSRQKESVFAKIFFNKSTFNASPVLPIDNAVIQINDLVFFDWERQIDDVTPTESISYEVFLKSAGKYIATAETDSNGLRLVNKIGTKQYASTIYYKALPRGQYDWGVRSIDNAWKGGSKEVGGFCTGSVSVSTSACQSHKIDTLVCEGTMLKFISKTNAKCIWYSEALGILGKSTTLDYAASTDDTLYCMQRNAIDCDKSYFVIIKIQKKQLLELGADKRICKGDSLQLNPMGKWDNYQWKYQGKTIATTAKLPKNKFTDSGYLSLYTSTKAGCTDKDSINITFLNNIALTAGADREACTQDVITLEVAGAKKCVWTLENKILDTASVQISVMPPAIPVGKKDITVEYNVFATDSLGCSYADTVKVKYHQADIIKVLDTTICVNDTIEFTPGRDIVTNIWSLDSTLLSDSDGSYLRFIGKKEGKYFIVVDVVQECGLSTFTHTINVVAPPPSVRLDTLINFGKSITLQMPNAVTTTWLPAEALDNPFANNPTSNPERNMVYTATAKDQYGCKYTGTFNITMRGNLSIPQLFTPNGDAINDVFKVYGFGISEIELSVVDRNGVKVYQTSNVADATNTGWDGTYDGALQPDGIYFWQIKGKFFDGKNLSALGTNQGEIRLVR